MNRIEEDCIRYAETLDAVEKNLKYTFKNRGYLLTALTHSSYANENHTKCNERLEFLGDAVLGFVVGSYMFKRFPDLPEGKLTKLRAGVVCETMLAKKARELQINKYMRLGNGEEMTGGRERPSIVADAFESIIAAMYVDGGIQPAADFVLWQLRPEIEEMNKSVKILDGKTTLQELLQRRSKELVEYVVVSETGPAHNKCFFVEVHHSGRVLGSGSGHSKKEAEQNAALDAISRLK